MTADLNNLVLEYLSPYWLTGPVFIKELRLTAGGSQAASMSLHTFSTQLPSPLHQSQHQALLVFLGIIIVYLLLAFLAYMLSQDAVRSKTF